jgi:hypothetical protein
MAVVAAAAWFGMLALLLGTAPAPEPLPRVTPPRVVWWPGADPSAGQNPAADRASPGRRPCLRCPGPPGSATGCGATAPASPPPDQPLRPGPAYLEADAAALPPGRPTAPASVRRPPPACRRPGRRPRLSPPGPRRRAVPHGVSRRLGSPLFSGVDPGFGAWSTQAWSAVVELRFDADGISAVRAAGAVQRASRRGRPAGAQRPRLAPARGRRAPPGPRGLVRGRAGPPSGGRPMIVLPLPDSVVVLLALHLGSCSPPPSSTPCAGSAGRPAAAPRLSSSAALSAPCLSRPPQRPHGRMRQVRPHERKRQGPLGKDGGRGQRPEVRVQEGDSRDRQTANHTKSTEGGQVGRSRRDRRDRTAPSPQRATEEHRETATSRVEHPPRSVPRAKPPHGFSVRLCGLCGSSRCGLIPPLYLCASVRTWVPDLLSQSTEGTEEHPTAETTNARISRKGKVGRSRRGPPGL